MEQPSDSRIQDKGENAKETVVDFSNDSMDEGLVCNLSSLQKQDEALNKDSKMDAKMVGHRAGFDAFMTGFTFAVYLAKFGKARTGAEKWSEMGMEEFRNKVSLSGKDIPLHVMKSNFAKTSREHREKMDRLKATIAGHTWWHILVHSTVSLEQSSSGVDSLHDFSHYRYLWQ